MVGRKFLIKIYGKTTNTNNVQLNKLADILRAGFG